MKSHSIVLLFLVSLLTFSCTDNVSDLGIKIQPSSDNISVGTDTFHVVTENVFIDSIFAKQDSFLLGTFYDTKYGSTQADILAQVNCPVNYQYPPGSVVDSVLAVLTYKTWFGDSYSPMNVSIYQMDKKTFNYSTLYPTNLDPSDYTTRSELIGNKTFTAKDATKLRTDTTTIVFKLSDKFRNWFVNAGSDNVINVASNIYSSESNFINYFKGMYITTDFGVATMLNVRQVDLELYYHYNHTVTSSTGADSLVTSNYVIPFPANAEVRQVNRFFHPEIATVKQKLAQNENVNYISSPAGIQTRVTVPLKRIKQKMDLSLGEKKKTLNSAILRVDATEIDSSTLAEPVVSYMLLIKESAIDRFFNKNELPSDTCAILGQFSKSQNTSTLLYEYHYSFDIAPMVANELKLNPNPDSDLNLRLVPVQVTSTTSSTGTTSITAVKQQTGMSAITILSGKDVTTPMRIKMIYSGF
ncbi:MAG: DUF4270 domain-containing protein [Paludibacter sp.]|nr:DUF4270 domain-containing protein [Paludibacter sp.]